MKVLIGGDIEGIATACDWDSITPGHPDYERNRVQYTKEMNAAIEGAFHAGATEVFVRDGHGGNKSLIPELLDKRAYHIKGRCSEDFRAMILTIENGYDAVLFIGYHAKARTPDGVMSHTMARTVDEFTLNGVSLPEMGYNALVAGMYDVPVVYLSGDRAACRQAKELFGDIVTTSVKEGLSHCSAICLHPQEACDRIRLDVAKALKRGHRCIFRMEGPYTMYCSIRRNYDAPNIEKTLHTASLEEALHLFWTLT
ncbi:MAG: M55 family metallopeptidase [Bacteroidales bacterium]|nr:M55 family metallopeptidase [Bacteroidales bacterium]MDD2264662.1 M55 family metallopeptidase [Bacteroidales bacterium]MDD2832228.1 M55 family metallopeptidase [Bacteroidales bacterium]MDD3209111.1 M55 family metallopeptidase [Bacteroidales bacterium]MDD3697881.1 M55 family metallopeptidase [Bacteroidales bacterium]